MNAKGSFKVVDILFTLLGCRIFRTSLCERMINLVLLIVFYTMVFSRLTVAYFMYENNLITVWLTKFWGTFFILAFHTTMLLKLSSMRKLLIDSTRLCMFDELVKARSYSLCSVLIYIVTSVIAFTSGWARGVVADTAELFGETRWRHVLAAADLAVPCLYDHQWPLIGFGVYCFVIWCWSVANDRLTEEAILSGPLNDDQCLTLMRRKRSLNDLKHDINRNMGFVPLLVMGCLLLRSTGIIFVLLRHGLKGVSGLLILVLYLIHTSLALLAIGLVCSLRARGQKKSKQLLIDWWKNSIAVQNAELGRSFRHEFNEMIPFSAILFDFDEKLVLGFVASLITFAVMFVQLNDTNLAKIV
ncbi:hypothetical protein HDE_03581 [Halotydeus destructor]|nr:hypothetical protein HDE_03581 [Halotydeus destructor]